MKSVVVIQHVHMEGPGRIADGLREAGIAIEVIEVFAGAPVPEEIPEDRGLIIMGGGMGVNDRDDPSYPFLQPEIELLRRALKNGNPILGICLGAQLLAHAAGASVFPNVRMDAAGWQVRAPEVGWKKVDLHGDEGEPVLAGLGREMMVLHWHGDTFELPAGATHLASTAVCRNQAFRIGPRVFGLQFHVEIDPDTAHRWAREDVDFVRTARGERGPDEVIAETELHALGSLRDGDRMIRNIVGCMSG